MDCNNVLTGPTKEIKGRNVSLGQQHQEPAVTFVAALKAKKASSAQNK